MGFQLYCLLFVVVTLLLSERKHGRNMAQIFKMSMLINPTSFFPIFIEKKIYFFLSPMSFKVLK